MIASVRFVATIIMVVCVFQIKAQKNNIWCFGDSAGIDFNNSAAPLLFNSAVVSRGSCASICDSIGNLLFYASYDADVYTSGGPSDYGGEVYTKAHTMMQNGDLVVMQLWYREVAIIPFPVNPNLFYVFSIGVTAQIKGLFYSLIDLSQNNGMGAVIQKNIQLNNYQANDGLTALKHGNGRDWWVVFRHYEYNNNEFWIYSITPNGIQGPFIQQIGSNTYTNSIRYIFSPDGNFLAAIAYAGLIELYNFNRCDGFLSFSKQVTNMNFVSPAPAFWSGEFSPNGRYLYISTSGDTSYLIQLDLQATNIWQSADTIWSEGSIKWAGGALKLAPDNRIYMTCAWNNGSWNYPYPDTVFNQINNFLSVIEYPDSAGQACSFQPYSFWLGNGRTYWGLPNNPDYDMPALAGSPCDTLTGIINNNYEIVKAEMFVTWVPEWKRLFVNAQFLKGTSVVTEIFDLEGRKIYSLLSKSVFKNHETTPGGYFSSTIDLPEISGGIYIIRLMSEREILSKKFIAVD